MQNEYLISYMSAFNLDFVEYEEENLDRYIAENDMCGDDCLDDCPDCNIDFESDSNGESDSNCESDSFESDE